MLIRPVVFCVALVAASPECEVGFGYVGRGEPTSTDVDSFKHCQASCVNGQCVHFTYDFLRKECWLLGQEAKLEPEVSSVSGAVNCEMPKYNREEETEEEKSKRIHRMVTSIAANVAKRSKDEVITGLAKHLEYSARNGYLAQEKYDNLMAVINAGISEMDSGSVARVVAYGHAIPTRDDFDWLLMHLTGQTGGLGNVEVVPPRAAAMGGKEACDGNYGTHCEEGARHSAGAVWTNAEVKYCFDQYIAVSARSAVDCAMAKIRSELPGIRFTNVGYLGRDACTTHPAIFIQSSDTGCWSNIGMQTSLSLMGLTGNQKLNLQVPGCNDCGTAIHEMLHSMGMAHEQARPDRDTYVEIEWDNIKSNMYSQFTKNPNADTSLDYDIMSIMHYGKFAYSETGKPSIIVKEAGYGLYTDDPDSYHLYSIGQRTMMTKNDVLQLARMYDCTSKTHCGIRPTDVPNVDEVDDGADHPPQTDLLRGNLGAVILIVGATIALVVTMAVCFCKGSDVQNDDQRSLLMAAAP